MSAEPERMGRLERLLALRSLPGLSQLEPSHLAMLAEVTKERLLRKGTTLSFAGEPVRAVHLLRSGEVAIMREGVAIRKYRGGDVVGSISALSRDPLGQHAVVTSDARTFEIERDDLEDVFEESFPLLHSALRGMMRGVLGARLQIPVDAGFPEPVLDSSRSHPRELGLVDRVLFGRRLILYGTGSVEALADLARDMTSIEIPRGAEVWPIGIPSPYSLLLYGGLIRCETTKGQTFSFGPDSVVGGIDSLAAEPRWFRAVAETDVVALRSDATHLMDVIEDYPEMGLGILRAAARVLSELNERVDRITLDGRVSP